jgi:hypothetical protein
MIDGILLQTAQEADLINPLVGRPSWDREPGLLNREEASLAFSKLDALSAASGDSGLYHETAQELGLTMLAASELRHPIAFDASKIGEVIFLAQPVDIPQAA